MREMKVKCQCGQVHMIKASDIGSKVRCNNCDRVFVASDGPPRREFRERSSFTEPPVKKDNTTKVVLLVVGGIILVMVLFVGLMAAIAIPSMRSTMIQANNTRAMAHLQSISVASELYFADYGVYPDSIGTLSAQGNVPWQVQFGGSDGLTFNYSNTSSGWECYAVPIENGKNVKTYYMDESGQVRSTPGKAQVFNGKAWKVEY